MRFANISIAVWQELLPSHIKVCNVCIHRLRHVLRLLPFKHETITKFCTLLLLVKISVFNLVNF